MQDILVSVLLPTRQRPQLVERSVLSLLTTAANSKQVEIIVAYDDDDSASRDFLNSAQWSQISQQFVCKTQTICCPKWGYAGLHNYFTAMAQQARGSWFMIWNDDAVMETAGWDQEILKNKNYTGMLHMNTRNFPASLCLFPLIPRVWLDLFGEISLHQLNDSWVQDICREADAVRMIPVTVFHDRYDATGNNLDATYQNRQYGKKLYRHQSMQAVRSEWAAKLTQYRASIDACDAKPLQI